MVDDWEKMEAELNKVIEEIDTLIDEITALLDDGFEITGPAVAAMEA